MKMYLPNDADGNVIPSNAKVMYEKDGSVVRVDDLVYGTASKQWHVLSGQLALEPSHLYLTKPDSLEQLAADIDRTLNHPEGLVCAYANRKRRECNGCKLSGQLGCLKAFTSDISSRVHHLAGYAE